MSSYDYDLLVIGSGPGGYVAAIRAAQLGMKTTVIERDLLGGVCLHWGCIPTKSIIAQADQFSTIPDLKKLGITVNTDTFNYHSVQKKSRSAASRLGKGVEYLLKKNGIEVIYGNAVLKSEHSVMISDSIEKTSKNILIATGSSPRQLPGFTLDETTILSSTGALQLEQLPESITIIGGGAIGIEFAHIFSTFGVKVYVIEMLDTILPFADKDAVAIVSNKLRKQKVAIHTSSKVESYTSNGKQFTLSLKTKNNLLEINSHKILIAIGRAPNSQNLGLEPLNITTDRGFIVTKQYYQTDIPSIYAIGDVINTPQLAHVASREGEIAVEHMAGLQPEPIIDPFAIPHAVYSEPQVAAFGITEDMAQEKNIAYDKAVFHYRGVGKSIAIGKTDGLIKIIFDKTTKDILAAHIAGKEATELIHEILVAKKAGLKPHQLTQIIHLHPSLSEIVLETAKAIEGRAIHG